RRAPGALPDTRKSLLAQPRECARDTRAREAATLDRREIVTDTSADLADCRRDRAECALCKARQELHQREVTEMGRCIGGKWRQRAEHRFLRLTEKATVLAVEDQEDAPGLGKNRADDDRGGAAP